MDPLADFLRRHNRVEQALPYNAGSSEENQR